MLTLQCYCKSTELHLHAFEQIWQCSTTMRQVVALPALPQHAPDKQRASALQIPAQAEQLPQLQTL